MPEVAAAGLAGLTVVSFESRRSEEMAELIRRHGGLPVIAPAMREVPLEDDSAAREFLRRIQGGEIDVTVFLTGVGLRALLSVLERSCPRAKLAELLGRTTLVARGPKSAAPLRELGLELGVIVPEPNTWREVLAALADRVPLAGRTVAVQEYGMTNQELVAGLEARGARVYPVPVYRWELPEDIGPLREAVGRLAGGEMDVVLFTSATQVDHVLRVADEGGLGQMLRDSARRLVYASVGPICSEKLRSEGLPVDIQPEHAKMGWLVQAVGQQAKSILAVKRQSR